MNSGSNGKRNGSKWENDVEFVDLKESEFSSSNSRKKDDDEFWDVTFEEDGTLKEEIRKEIELIKNENNVK
jgi:hypothetical protein